ncbi:MAG: hypothetical protein GY795_33690, partial [Desulfobacterales bacterium]|nr:hypothetical protein [Desulfobacterales bacterium]
KAWGFNPRLGGIRVCALKGRREADLPTFPAPPLQGAKINNNSNLGLRNPRLYHFAALRHLKCAAPETVEFTNSIYELPGYCLPSLTGL